MGKVAVGGLLVDSELCRVVEQELAPGAGVQPLAFWEATAQLIQQFAPRNKVRHWPRGAGAAAGAVPDL